MSSASNLHSVIQPFNKALTYVKNSKVPSMEPCGTPAKNIDPFKTYFLLKSPIALKLQNFVDITCRSFKVTKYGK